jgi:hypothetical protein
VRSWSGGHTWQGKTPHDFLAIANGYIHSRRLELLADSQRELLTLLPEALAYLTLDEACHRHSNIVALPQQPFEWRALPQQRCAAADPPRWHRGWQVLAVRLYSGPAFQPINAFLRDVVNLSDTLRHRLACHPGLTFTATVGHLCRAIRKLAAVATDAEASQPLWRGVRGELPRSFYMLDEQVRAHSRRPPTSHLP